MRFLSSDLFGRTHVQEPWPIEIRLLDQGQSLKIIYDDHAAFQLSAELLRVRSPSAEVQGHSAAERKTLGGKRQIKILTASQVGNYAMRLEFDDGHHTGIYTWSYLRELGETQQQSFADYLLELTAKGLNRDQPGER